MQNLPLVLDIFFTLTTAFAVYFFYRATNKSKVVLGLSLSWLLAQALISATGFYTNNQTLPPPMILLIAPPFLTIIFLFATAKGRSFLDSLNYPMLTYLNVVRVPVETTLYFLFVYGQIPEVMTFAGRNMDILAGITAPSAAYLYFTKKSLSKTGFLIWNCISLMLVIHIAITGLLSVATPFQQFGLEQPNRALGNFPYSWLPSYIVPVVLLSHFTLIRKFSKRKIQHTTSASLNTNNIRSKSLV